MSELLYALVAVTAAFLLICATGCALILRTLGRANRVVAGRRSSAPLGWLWSWRQPARLHRRLRRVVQVADGAVASITPTAPARRVRPAPTTPLHDVADQLKDRAALVDSWLVAASRLHPQWNRRQLATLSAEVRELEGSAYRLRELSSQWRVSLDRAVHAHAVLPDLHERLDAVQAALQDLPTGV